MIAPLAAVVGVLGLMIGSFLNVVIYRVPRGESVLRPGSHCPACDAPVRAWQNLPVVSWLVLRGRCGSCRAPIGIRYPLVEAGTGLLFAAVAARFGASPALPAFLYLAAISVALAMIDFAVRRLPDVIVLPSYLVAAALLAVPVVAHHDWWAGLRALIAMAVLGGGYLLLALVYPGGMGLGDVKLAGVLGLYLGYLGWGYVWIGTFAGFLLGGVVGVALLATRRAGRRSSIPFGPYMLAGALLATFVAGPVGHWYTSLLTHPA